MRLLFLFSYRVNKKRFYFRLNAAFFATTSNKVEKTSLDLFLKEDFIVMYINTVP